MKPWMRITMLFVAVLSLACQQGEDDPVDPGNGGGGGGGGTFFRATIDGTAWQSDANQIQFSGNPVPSRQGAFVITGAKASTGVSLMLHLSFITGPGTYALGVDPSTTPGGEGSVGVATASDLDTWETWLTGSAGSVTITTRTNNRIAGTFQFTATANPGTPPGTKAVTAGAFDITVPGGLSPLPTDTGSTLMANLGGTAWNAATVTGNNLGGGTFTAGGTTLQYALSLQPKVAMSAGNTYGVPSEIDILVQQFDPGNSWNGGVGADVGSVTIITLDSNRLVATFSGTLPPAISGSALVLTDGEINTFLQN